MDPDEAAADGDDSFKFVCPDGLELIIGDDCLRIYNADPDDKKRTRISDTIYLLEMENEKHVQLVYMYHNDKLEQVIGRYDLKDVDKEGLIFQRLIGFLIANMPYICEIKQRYIRLLGLDPCREKLKRGWRITYIEHDYLKDGDPIRTHLNPFFV